MSGSGNGDTNITDETPIGTDTGLTGESTITNETTIWRRAWVAEALEGVRSRMGERKAAESGQDEPRPDEKRRITREQERSDAAKKKAAKKPHLYVAWSSEKPGQ